MTNRFEKKYFPTIVDNFFENPDKIRKFGLSLDYTPDSDGHFPGVRSKSLHEIDYEMYMSLMLKFMSMFHDFAFQNVNWMDASVYFHKIKDTGDEELNKGWIHTDNDHELAGLCYLNPGVTNLDWGTSIYKQKDNTEYMRYGRQHYKNMFYKNEPVDLNKYKKSLKENNENFQETIRVGNVYNRMIAYSAPENHCHNGVTKDEERLTLLFFINGLTPDRNRFPNKRVKDPKHYDNFIHDRIDELNKKEDDDERETEDGSKEKVRG